MNLKNCQSENIESVKRNLSNYKMEPLENHSIKTQQRILLFEEYAHSVDIQRYELVEQLRRLKLSTVSFFKSNTIGVTRKTIYNDEALKEYMDNRIKNQRDYLGENKIKALNITLNEYKEKNQKLQDNLVLQELLQIENDKLKKELKEKDNKIEDLLRYIDHELNGGKKAGKIIHI